MTPTPVSHSLLPELLGLENTEFHTIKQALAAHEVNARGWRLYADYGDAIFLRFEDAHREPIPARFRLPALIALLKLLAACEMDVLPPPALLGSIWQWQLPRNDLALIPAALFRTLWKTCIAITYEHDSAAAPLNAFIKDEIIPCMQWYFASGQHRNEDRSWRNAAWSTIRRQWQSALYTQIVTTRSPATALKGAEWPVFVNRICCDGYVFQALHNSAALVNEGEQMNHCVGNGDYAEYCQTSMTRIFAILDPYWEEHIGTVALSENAPGHWQVDMISGFSNAALPVAVENAAETVASILGDLWYRQPDVRQAMNDFRRSCQADSLRSTHAGPAHHRNWNVFLDFEVC